HQRPARRVNHNSLAAAHRNAALICALMASFNQTLDYAISHRVFHQHARASQVAVSRRFYRLLQVHSEINEIRQHLHVSLRLNASAHHAERTEELSILEDHSRYDRVKRALARFYAISVRGVERKSRAAIMQKYSCVAC